MSYTLSHDQKYLYQCFFDKYIIEFMLLYSSAYVENGTVVWSWQSKGFDIISDFQTFEFKRQWVYLFKIFEIRIHLLRIGATTYDIHTIKKDLHVLGWDVNVYIMFNASFNDKQSVLQKVLN